MVDFYPKHRNFLAGMKFYSSIPVLQVKTIDAALAFYVDVLGFTVDFKMRDYAGIHLGKASIYLCSHNFHERPIGGGAVTLVCNDIDPYYNKLVENKVPIKFGAGERRYGMKDFAITDPDGNVLTIGCELKREETLDKATVALPEVQKNP